MKNENTLPIEPNEIPQISTRKPKLTVKKITPEMRRKKINFLQEPNWYKRLVWRLKEDSQFLRSTVQITFLVLCVWIGVEFYLFLKWGNSGGTEAFVSRPPGVEGFLPISALISLKYFLLTGFIANIHPSGLFIFIAAIALALLLKKSFCSWLCPIGTFSESLWQVGQALFKKNLTITKWLDYPLRSIKYLLLLFFMYSVLQMDAFSLRQFIVSPYNKVADIKMYMFFAHLTEFAALTLLVLMFLSIVIKNFWCRYLCPYGALLGAISWLSPLKITRNISTCVDCELCTKACPSNIKVHTATRVWSDECTGCLECVQVCPVKDTLDVRSIGLKNKIPTWVFGTLVVGVFVAITGLAMLTGNWQNSISKEEYLRRIPEIESSKYQHFESEE